MYNLPAGESLSASRTVDPDVAFRAEAICNLPAELHHQTEGRGEIYNFSFLLKMPNHSLGFTVYFHWADGPDGWGPVGEGVPLTLDAGVVCVERLADADDVQAGLVGQLGQEL